MTEKTDLEKLATLLLARWGAEEAVRRVHYLARCVPDDKEAIRLIRLITAAGEAIGEKVGAP